MTEPLVSIATLSVWAQTTIDADDDYAAMVLNLASELCRDAAEHPEWTESTVPPRAKIICLTVARRTYLNPDGTVAAGSIGPVGGDRVLNAYGAGMKLLPDERAELASMRGDPDDWTTPGPGGELWVQPTYRADRLESSVMYLDDEAGQTPIPYLSYQDPAWVGPNGEVA